MVKNLPASTGDAGLISRLAKSPGEGNGNPLQCSCLKNPQQYTVLTIGPSRKQEELFFKRIMISSVILRLSIGSI